MYYLRVSSSDVFYKCAKGLILHGEFEDFASIEDFIAIVNLVAIVREDIFLTFLGFAEDLAKAVDVVLTVEDHIVTTTACQLLNLALDLVVV